MRKIGTVASLGIQAVVYLGGIMGVLISAEMQNWRDGRLPNEMICVTEDQVGLCKWEGKIRFRWPD